MIKQIFDNAGHLSSFAYNEEDDFLPDVDDAKFQIEEAVEELVKQFKAFADLDKQQETTR